MLDIPQELQDRLNEFKVGRKHGNITLNIKDGLVVSWEIAEKGRIDRKQQQTVA